MEAALQSLINWWKLSGIDVPEIKPAPKQRTKPAARNTAPAPTKAKAKLAARPLAPPAPSPDERLAAAQTLAKGAKTLDALRSAIEGFDAGSLSDGARGAVFSRGNPQAAIMVIGEAPGRDEDQAGKPFVGRSGQLLDKILGSIGLDEDALYLTNVVNWRPPNNRNLEPDEIALCLPFIHRHIELQKPKTIILVGGVAMTALTERKGITKSRGEWVEITAGSHTAPAQIIYHPAYLLRHPEFKRETWRDMLALRAHLDMQAGGG